ncbi:hypothetical protein ACFO9E_06210 [Streptomyces maoxianensis]|uniref:AG1 protein n=1 Tax=Streptomyces maoxianensis TaxID=1459942 RepID=A0ABV9G1M6_9ACTN
MAWGEWEQLKSEAAEKESTGMQLNQAPAGHGGGQGDFVAHQDDLGAVGHEAFILHDHLSRQADIAGAGMDKDGSGSTMQAAVSLKSRNFGLGSALETTVSMWDSQLKSLLQACAHISNHLDYSKALHANDDAQIAASIRQRDGAAVPVSRLNEYFK